MSLDWNISNCENWEELKTEEEWPITDALIWATVGIDLGRITEKNVDEFFTRLKMLEAVHGPLLYKWNEEQKYKESLITYPDVQRRIGLHTNVSNKTNTQFDKRMSARLRSDASGLLRYRKEAWENEQRDAA